MHRNTEENNSYSSYRPRKLRIGREKISQDIHRVVKQLGKQPSSADYKKYGKHSWTAICNAFEGKNWKQILSSLGYKPVRRIHDAYSYDEIVAQIKRVEQLVGHLPTYKEYRQLGKISYHAISRFTKTTKWAEVLAVVYGLDATIVKEKIRPKYKNLKQQIREIRNITTKLNRVPTTEEAIKHGINVDLVIRNLGSNWLEVVKAIGLKNVNESQKTLRKPIVSDQEMLEDVNRVAKKLGFYPTANKYENLGCYSANNIMYRFNSSWLNIIDLAKSLVEKQNLTLARPKANPLSKFKLTKNLDKDFGVNKTAINQIVLDYFASNIIEEKNL